MNNFTAQTLNQELDSTNYSIHSPQWKLEAFNSLLWIFSLFVVLGSILGIVLFRVFLSKYRGHGGPKILPITLISVIVLSIIYSAVALFAPIDLAKLAGVFFGTVCGLILAIGGRLYPNK